MIATSLAPVAGAATARHQVASSSTASRMVVFLRTQSASSAHGGAARVRDAQRSVRLAASSSGVKVLAASLVPNTLVVSGSPAQLQALKANPNVAAVLPDALIPGPKVQHVAASAVTRRGADAPSAGLCGTAASPQLNPEALSNINAPAAWGQGATGAGVTVAYLADGVDPANPDLQRNAAFASAGSAAGSAVVTSSQDFSGDGTAAPTAGAEAFGDVSSIAAQGNTTYDLSNYVNAAHPLPAGCDIKVVGVSPGASVLALKVFAQNNTTTGSGFVQAISYAVTHGAKVINESFGGNVFPDNALDITRAANDAAVAAGVTVVVSTGDAGITSTIGSPSSDPAVIGVGATTTFRSYLQDTFGGINWSGASGKFVDDNISSLSSGGFAQDGKTVDLVAPGDLNWALCSADKSTYSECSGQDLQNFGGTSESSPLTAGAAADVISAYRAHHGGAFPTPAVVKQILMSTTTDISAPAEQMGAGLLNVGRATALAASMPGTSAKATATGVVSSTGQLDLSGAPGQKLKAAVSLTNLAKTGAKVTLSTRQLVASGNAAGSVTLDPSTASTQPTLKIWSGADEVYQTATFTVPAGSARVKLASSYTFTGQTSLLHVALFDPTGAYAGYSVPQGLGDYADVEVANPVAGKWTAVFFTVSNAFGSGNVGTSGTVLWNASFWRFAPAGSIASSVTLGGHATKSVNLSVTVPPVAGDTAESVVVKSGSSSFTIPVVIRSAIPISHGFGSFTGVLTGGNGRAGAPAQSNTYNLTVPAKLHDLDVSIQMSANPGAGYLPGDQVVAYLVNEGGQTVAYDTNYTLAADGSGVATPYVNLYTADPAPGNYQVLLQWANPVTGAALSALFYGAVQFNAVNVSSSLPAGSSVSATSGLTTSVTVRNEGLAPMTLFADPRLSTTAQIPLTDPSPQSLPNHASSSFFVPTQSSSLAIQTSSSVPTTFDFGSDVGDPDLSPTMAAAGLQGSVGSAGASALWAPAGGVQSGAWYVQPAEIGPYTGPEPSATVSTNVVVTTKDFNEDVTTSTGDAITDLMGYTQSWVPLTINAGSTATITLTIKPSVAEVGKTISGLLSIDSISTGAFLNGTIIGSLPNVSSLANLPYSYKVTA